MISQEVRGELIQRAKHLESSDGNVSLIEAAAYRAIANFSQDGDWMNVGCVADQMLVPTIYQDLAPEIIEYAQLVGEQRSEAIRTARRSWERMLSAGGINSELLIDCVDKFIDYPGLVLSVSPSQLDRTANLLRIKPEIIRAAMIEVPYWKASEMVEWRNWLYPQHDITSWIARDPLLFTESAMTQHQEHETYHNGIDYFSSSCGWPVSNWLTEGFCELWSGDFEAFRSHGRKLVNQFGGVESVTMSNIIAYLDGKYANTIEFPDYTLGWAINYAASAACAEDRRPENGCGAFLFKMEQQSRCLDLNSAFKNLVQNKVINENAFNNALQKRLSLGLS